MLRFRSCVTDCCERNYCNDISALPTPSNERRQCNFGINIQAPPLLNLYELETVICEDPNEFCLSGNATFKILETKGTKASLVAICR